MCCWWSGILPLKILDLICWMSSLKLLDPWVSSLALVFSANARDMYRCNISLKIQGTPSPRQASLPISFCMSWTLNNCWSGYHFESSSLTCWRYSLVIPTDILLVLMTRLRIIWDGPTDGLSHFSRESGIDVLLCLGVRGSKKIFDNCCRCQ